MNLRALYPRDQSQTPQKSFKVLPDHFSNSAKPRISSRNWKLKSLIVPIHRKFLDRKNALVSEVALRSRRSVASDHHVCYALSVTSLLSRLHNISFSDRYRRQGEDLSQSMGNEDNSLLICPLQPKKSSTSLGKNGRRFVSITKSASLYRTLRSQCCLLMEESILSSGEMDI